ncbi:threonine transporter [Corynebacterium sp. HMSC08C04]|uniref:LysE family translocator n=1 Tax=Corynebacterium TaxID=1716 RepID=UPI0008A4182B|nr:MULTISPECIES: LysE family translocator [Corynebacterium]OFM04561.1 threonine transporter [Corynebacterium sp. HMSC071F07]OFT35326.1 threonine transporter [Corynebacterium sp. HMSC08C04]OFT47235.1 threonine transporter [Corynebacterium sp. HMSC06G04]OHO66290.1 threonine transporter [Corynebacterium sp. HMSC036D03]
MTLAALVSLLGVWVAMIVAPGPDVVQVIRVAPRSMRAGIMCALGICTGIVVWLTASLAGLSALIAARPSLLGLLQLVGGGFLLWMAYGSIRSGLAQRRSALSSARSTSQDSAENAGSFDEEHIEQAVSTGDVEDITAGRAYKLGLLTNLSNPKALVFFGAVFAQFIRPDMGLEWTVFIAIILTVVSVAWFSTFALIVRAAARFLTKYSAHLDIGSGLIFGALGCVMIYEGILALVR